MAAPDPPLGPVVITPREIYDPLVLLRDAVRELVQGHQDADRQLGDHEARIRSLERGRWPLPSIAALVSIAALIVAALALR